MAVSDLLPGLHALGTREIMEGTKQVPIFGVGISFSIIAIVVMSFRIYCRVHIISCGLGLDDYLMLLGVVCNVALSIASMICAWYGVGVHLDQIPVENYSALLKANWAARFLYVFAIGFVKLSILVFYLRLDHGKWTRWVVYFVMLTVIFIIIGSSCVNIFECSPPSLFWDAMLAADVRLEKCMHPDDMQLFYENNGIFNIAQDAVIWLIPVPMLWKLQVPRRQKIGASFLFCIGIVALVAGCVRFYYVIQLRDEVDTYYSVADALSWCSIEVYAAIICGSASTFRVLIRTFMPRIWGSQYNQSGTKGYNRSNTRDFALGSFAAGRTNDLSGDSPLSDGDHTFLDSHSESSVRHGGSNGRQRIMLKNESSVKVTDAGTPGPVREVSPFSQV